MGFDMIYHTRLLSAGKRSYMEKGSSVGIIYYLIKSLSCIGSYKITWLKCRLSSQKYLQYVYYFSKRLFENALSSGEKASWENIFRLIHSFMKITIHYYSNHRIAFVINAKNFLPFLKLPSMHVKRDMITNVLRNTMVNSSAQLNSWGFLRCERKKIKRKREREREREKFARSLPLSLAALSCLVESLGRGAVHMSWNLPRISL